MLGATRGIGRALVEALARRWGDDGIVYLNRIGIDNIERHVLQLCSQLSDGLTRLGAEVLTPKADHARAGIVTACFPNWTGEQLSERLAQRQVVTLPRLNGVRFAPHLYNDSADIVRTLQVVAELNAVELGVDSGSSGPDA